MKAFCIVCLYFVIGFNVAAIRLVVYAVNLEDFASFTDSPSENDQIATLFIILGWPIYVLLKLCLAVPKLIATAIKERRTDV